MSELILRLREDGQASEVIIDGQDIANHITELRIVKDARGQQSLHLVLTGNLDVTMDGAVISTEHAEPLKEHRPMPVPPRTRRDP